MFVKLIEYKKMYIKNEFNSPHIIIYSLQIINNLKPKRTIEYRLAKASILNQKQNSVAKGSLLIFYGKKGAMETNATLGNSSNESNLLLL